MDDLELSHEQLEPHLDEWQHPPAGTDFPWYVGALVIAICTMVGASMWLAPFVDFKSNPLQTIFWSALLAQVLPTLFIIFVLMLKVPRPRWVLELYAWRPTTQQIRYAITWTLLAFIFVLISNICIYLVAKYFDYELESHLVIDLIKDASPQGQFLLVVVAVVLAPIAEELLFRVVLFRTLTHYLGSTAGIVWTSFVFGVIHFMPAFIISLFILGLVLQLTMLKTRNIWVPILIHAGFNGITLTFAMLAPAQ